MENRNGNNGGCIGGLFVLIIIIAIGYFAFTLIYKAIDSFDFSSLFLPVSVLPPSKDGA